jgi:hypothetical protein
LVITKDAWDTIRGGVAEWAEEYGDRMMAGAEKAHWDEAPWVMSKIQGEINEYARQAGYTFGYTFGYVSEQILTGVLTGGVGKIGVLLTKGGINVSARLAARRVLPVVGRLHFVKKWAASAGISIEMKTAVERGLASAAEAPVSFAVKDSAVEAGEKGLARTTYDRFAFSKSKILDEFESGQYIKKLIQTPNLQGRVWHRQGEWFHLFGEEATAAATKGWVKTYNRSLVFQGDALVDDRMPDLYKLVKAETSEGMKALRKSLEEFSLTDGNGKLWLRDMHTVHPKR